MVQDTDQAGHYPWVGELRLGTSKIWSGEASFGDAGRFEVMYMGRKDGGLVAQAVRVIVDRVYLDERGYRSRAAAAWFQRLQEAIPYTTAWTIDDLIDAMRIRTIFMSPDPRDILIEYSIPALAELMDKDLKTWFNPDGSVHHISGSLPY